LPALGICLGSQLLAKAMGAKVYPNRIKEIGWYPLEMLPATADDPLFAGCQCTETVFQWHGICRQVRCFSHRTHCASNKRFE
jgi:GMP synthase-like glutamine amidotransferase